MLLNPNIEIYGVWDWITNQDGDFISLGFHGPDLTTKTSLSKMMRKMNITLFWYLYQKLNYRYIINSFLYFMYFVSFTTLHYHVKPGTKNQGSNATDVIYQLSWVTTSCIEGDLDKCLHQWETTIIIILPIRKDHLYHNHQLRNYLDLKWWDPFGWKGE